MIIFFSPLDLSHQHETCHVTSLLRKQSSLEFHALSGYSCISLCPITAQPNPSEVLVSDFFHPTLSLEPTPIKLPHPSLHQNGSCQSSQ